MSSDVAPLPGSPAETPLVQMLDAPYPKNEAEFHARFGDEEACRKHLMALRWPSGFVCPRCNSGGRYLATREKWECYKCEYQCSIRAGTVMQASKKPLTMWFAAIYYMIESKQGFSALGLMRRLNLKSYQTAWSWFQKLRDYLEPDKDLILGKIETDVFYVGGKAKGAGVRGIGSPKKLMIACAIECAGRGSGRVRLKLVKDKTATTLEDFLRATVAKGSTVLSDADKAYNGLTKMGYVHDMVESVDDETVSSHLPRMFRVQRLVKGMMSQTHMGAVSPWRLQRYLDEYTFRFERKKAPVRFELFKDVLDKIVTSRCRTVRAIMADRDPEAGGYAKAAKQSRGRKITERGRQWWKGFIPPLQGEAHNG